MGEPVPAELDWKWRETRDGDIGRARFKCFDLGIQDMDGDGARWHIKRGEQYFAMGETYWTKEEDYMDAAQRIVRETLVHLWRAVEMNDFVANELPKLKAQGLA